MLRECEFPGCATRTLSAYCLEHEFFTRTETEIELAQPLEGADAEVVAAREAAG